MRIYLAGKISGNTMDFLTNIHNGIAAQASIIKAGHSVFPVFCDFLMHLNDKTLTEEDYKRNSLDWLEVAEQIWVLPGWETSNGVKAEIERAIELNITVRYL